MATYKRDSFIFGSIIGLVLPLLAFGVFYIIKHIFFSEMGSDIILTKGKIALISVFINLFPMRYYLVKLKYDKTGRGILLSIFVLGILYFIFVHNTGMQLL